jgi:hypothetical protein
MEGLIGHERFWNEAEELVTVIDALPEEERVRLNRGLHGCAVCGRETEIAVPVTKAGSDVPNCEPCWTAGKDDKAIRDKVYAMAEIYRHVC